VRTLNLGILAHVDAGKTSLTERLLYAAGVIDAMGRVDDGNTQTDSLELERRRGITIRSAVVSFVIDGVTVNLIDTPGHPDFIAEVDRVLGVLDGAVLVISAVEGVQAQTGLLLRALRRLQVPTLLFVNKVDRTGARPDQVLDQIADRLTPAVVAMASTRGAGTRDARVVPLQLDAAGVGADVLADGDEALLAAYVAGARLPAERLRRALAEQTRRAAVHPVYFGSAITGAGIDTLIGGITSLLPVAEGDHDGPLSATVFKVERGPAGQTIAYARLFSGVLHTRDRVPVGTGEGRSDQVERRDSPVDQPDGRGGDHRGDEHDGHDRGQARHGQREQTVTAISVFDRGPARRTRSVAAGQIAQLWGLTGVRVGDTIGAPRPGTGAGHFAPPTLEAVIEAVDPRHAAALHTALVQLAEQDPLIALRQDDVRHELFVSLYGEIQKEVLRDTLAADHGIAVELRETTTVCVERPIATGRALEVRGQGANPFAASVGLRIEPAPERSRSTSTGAPLRVRSEVELGSIPAAFHTAVEETARATLQQGLCGWPVVDATVVVTHCDHRPPPVPVGGFRDLTPLVAMAALADAGTTVCEPIHRFHLELPSDTVAAAFAALARLEAVPDGQTTRGTWATLDGDIRAVCVHRLQQQVAGITRGEGVLETAFSSYRPVHGPPPVRPRTDLNPLHRDEYLLRLSRRLSS
jgi:ribosomal protection tetracycline resistance protein